MPLIKNRPVYLAAGYSGNKLAKEIKFYRRLKDKYIEISKQFKEGSDA